MAKAREKSSPGGEWDMRILSFTISVGGSGKSLLTACTAAQVALNGHDVVVIDDAAEPMIGRLYGLNPDQIKNSLHKVVQYDRDVEEAIYESPKIKGLKYISSGIPLASYFDVDPVAFAEKIMNINADYLFMDMRHPAGLGAVLSLGVSHYYILGPLKSDEMMRSIDEAVDTMKLGILLRAVPLGFVINQPHKQLPIPDELVKKLEDLFRVECLAVIDYDPRLAGVFNEGILPVTEWPKSRFSMAIHRIAEHIMGELPKPKKEDIAEFVRSFVRYIR